MARLGALALACYGVHAVFHVARGHASDALWACHVATLLVSLGAFLEQARPAAIGILWLSFGNALWVLDLSTGGEFFPTSLLTHVLGLGVGLVVVKKLGWPYPSWWRAALAFLALLVVTRAVTPPAENVNLAFSVATGFERWFPSYLAYLAMLIAVGALTFLVVELGLRKALS